jgi:hypothetical protein
MWFYFQHFPHNCHNMLHILRKYLIKIFTNTQEMKCLCSQETSLWPLVPADIKNLLHLWGLSRKIHTLDKTENAMYSERKNEKAESGFVSAKLGHGSKQLLFAKPCA